MMPTRERGVNGAVIGLSCLALTVWTVLTGLTLTAMVLGVIWLWGQVL